MRVVVTIPKYQVKQLKSIATTLHVPYAVVIHEGISTMLHKYRSIIPIDKM